MPDICMCSGNECPIKNQCKRFTATPSEYGQSYFFEIPGKWVWPENCSDQELLKSSVWSCDMLWADRQDEILTILKTIVK